MTKKRLACALSIATLLVLMVSPAMAVENCDQVCGPGVSGSTACAIPWSGKVINCQIWDWFFGFAFASPASEFTRDSSPATCSAETEWYTETYLTVAK